MGWGILTMSPHVPWQGAGMALSAAPRVHGALVFQVPEGACLCVSSPTHRSTSNKSDFAKQPGWQRLCLSVALLLPSLALGCSPALPAP